MAHSSASVFSSLVDSAQMEFQSCLQLLAERARFLAGADGVAVAFQEGSEFVYCAASGNSVPEPGTFAELGNEAIRKCVEERQPITSIREGVFALTTPIVKDNRVIGLFRLQAQHEFDEQDIEAIVRLAELVTIGMDQRDAAGRAESLVQEEGMACVMPEGPPSAVIASPPVLAAAQVLLDPVTAPPSVTPAAPDSVPTQSVASSAVLVAAPAIVSAVITATSDAKPQPMVEAAPETGSPVARPVVASSVVASSGIAAAPDIGLPEFAAVAPGAAPTPVTWHTPEASGLIPQPEASKKTAPSTPVQACVACGFPVSPGRRLCVECEQKPGVRSSPPPELFAAAQKHEGFLSAHGYTIASLLVTALTAAIIWWLRR